MYAEYVNAIDEEDLYYERPERSSDIQLPPAINTLLLTVWAAICCIGFAVMFLMKSPVAGAVIIAIPTFIGMVIKPTFALCIMMLVLPTGAGIGYRQDFSLDRGVGIAVAISFALNLLISRPRLRIGNKALWVLAAYTLWIFLSSLASPYLRLDLRRSFTQLQILALVLIVYWIIETNAEATFRWALRAYVVGTLGTIILAFKTGAAMRTMTDITEEERYAATLGGAIDANMLAVMVAMAFLAAVYLLASDKRILLRVIYLAAVLFLPIMLLRIGSRGALIALAFTLLSPLLFVRQVAQRPVLLVLLLGIILLASFSMGFIIKSEGLEAGATQRLTDVPSAREAFDYRMNLNKVTIQTAMRRPFGTSHYDWFRESGLRSHTHNDLLYALGTYGVPGAVIFATFMITLLLTVKRTPVGLEKLYSRAVLTFLIITGLNINQTFQKHFWVFLAIVLATERISYLMADHRQSTDRLYEEEMIESGY
ncbi:MAG: O-antigen ligase family protein [Phycisphaerales bacterium]|nr:MAG: O-antigen ligase family protein [Phycisphaerales bacterium]